MATRLHSWRYSLTSSTIRSVIVDRASCTCRAGLDSERYDSFPRWSQHPLSRGGAGLLHTGTSMHVGVCSSSCTTSDAHPVVYQVVTMR